MFSLHAKKWYISVKCFFGNGNSHLDFLCAITISCYTLAKYLKWSTSFTPLLPTLICNEFNVWCKLTLEYLFYFILYVSYENALNKMSIHISSVLLLWNIFLEDTWTLLSILNAYNIFLGLGGERSIFTIKTRSTFILSWPNPPPLLDHKIFRKDLKLWSMSS